MNVTATRRAKLGIMVPAVNTVLEPESYKMAPKDVSVHFSRVISDGGTPEVLADMIKDVPKAAEELRRAGVNAISFGCTGGSLIKGVGYDEEIIELIEDNAGIPATTTTTAVVEALRAVSMKQISVATPYVGWLVEKTKGFLEASGFRVLKIVGLELWGDEVAEVPPQQVYELAKDVCVNEGDGVFISCTNFRTIEILERLERDLNKPVVSSNQATVWKLLRMANIKDPVKGFGKLLTQA